MVRARRALRQHPDIWPGFVDALSTLLLVIIFLLVVFVLAQFFLNQLLQGKDTQLQSLEQAIAELTDQLEHRAGDQRRAAPVGRAAVVGPAVGAWPNATTPRRCSPTSEAERDQFRDQLFAARGRARRS